MQFALGAKKAGERIRIMIAWSACTGALKTPNRIGTDLDLFLYNKTRGAYLYASQSNDDNNESMDVLIPEGWDGEYVAYVARPDGAKSCADTPANERFIFGGYK